ncbi:methylated-DNA--[protein]-cysteine S-methyltransferase [Paenibacillus provencensis]|uniref:Methylated-DNA--[protein]-cysteine S-methyltransferase n=1 Tax=Paenibacillus provencensis TaxID=441151 RepID=A0ABW3PXC0_9BACL|nr:methylated-DNA--[protein]-cysteine S-methyltransferase [Paenibacillus sp. MER 78]MCM3128559.1 methylated-DNA--[protein]-cysteine S-methyltransferase [Paenibacillus sp. MER 78]
METVYWAELRHSLFQNQTMYIAATENGLCKVTWPTDSMEVLMNWIYRRFPRAEMIENPEKLAPYLTQLIEYMDGARQSFSLPLDLRGTAFQTKVWRELQQIPFGETRSYSDIAYGIDHPQAVRAVGTANGANPVPIIVPCHRVIGKNNTLTGFAGGLKVKEALLNLEGYHGYTAAGHARFQF